MSKNVVPQIQNEAKAVEESILNEEPSLRFPIRSSRMCRYLAKRGISRSAERRRSARHGDTVKTFAQTLRMMALSKALSRRTTSRPKAGGVLRLKNWDEAGRSWSRRNPTRDGRVEALSR